MRKGVFFSFIMVFLTVTITTLVAIQNSLISSRREEIFIESRINSMNNLYESIVRDIQKSLEIIAIRAMAVAFMNVSSPPGKPFTEANVSLRELILYGTLDGSPMSLMENATFLEWIDKIKEVSELKGFSTDINVNSMTIKPYDSFNLEIETNISINITDEQGIASLNKFSLIDSLVDIENLEDPLYPLKTEGLGNNIIKKSPYEGNYTQLLLTGNGDNGWTYGESVNVTWTDVDGISNKDEKILVTDHAELIASATLNQFKGVVSDAGTNAISKPYVNNTVDATNIISTGMNILVDGDSKKVWFIDNLIEDAENSYYHSSVNGPSYLDRLEGHLTCNYCETGKIIGLESFIDKNELGLKGVPIVIERTNVDYLYFTGGTLGSCVKGLDSTFRIDDIDEHEAVYNVTDLITSCS